MDVCVRVRGWRRVWDVLERRHTRAIIIRLGLDEGDLCGAGAACHCPPPVSSPHPRLKKARRTVPDRRRRVLRARRVVKQRLDEHAAAAARAGDALPHGREARLVGGAEVPRASSEARAVEEAGRLGRHVLERRALEALL